MNIIKKNKNFQWFFVLKKMFKKEYWNKENTVEFIAFLIKAIIIVPGLLLNLEIWWLYFFALISSLGLIWSSTIKTIPTLIWFNILWILLSTTYIIKYVLGEML